MTVLDVAQQAGYPPHPEIDRLLLFLDRSSAQNSILGDQMSIKTIGLKLVPLLGLALFLVLMAPAGSFAQSCPAGNKRCGDGCIPNNWQCCSHTAYHTRDKNKGVPCGAGATCCFNPQSQNSMSGHFCCAPGNRCDVSAGKRSGRCVQ